MLNQHDATEILLKVALSIINQIKQILNKQNHGIYLWKSGFWLGTGRQVRKMWSDQTGI
jgi:hypothetical protein